MSKSYSVFESHFINYNKMQNLSNIWDTTQPCHDNCISGYVLRYKQKPESHGKKTSQGSK